MGAVAFDTLKFAQTLRDKRHVPQDQAEGIAQAFADALADEMVAKTYFDSRLEIIKSEIESRLQVNIAEIDNRLKLIKADSDSRLQSIKSDADSRLEATKTEILKWTIGTIGFQTLVILGAVLALTRFGR